MAFIRKEHKEDYTCISNDVFKSDLSLKARGMLCTLLSFPDDWEFSENGLQKIFRNDGQTSIRTALKELEATGFLKRTRERGDNGRYGDSVWLVSDYKCFEKPNFENHKWENHKWENRPQLNTKESNIYISSTNRSDVIMHNAKISKTNIRRDVEKRRFAPPKLEEVQKYCDERKNGIDAQHFLDYYRARGWMIGRSHIKDWKACVRTWERNSYAKAEQPKSAFPDYDAGDIYKEDGTLDMEAMALNFWKPAKEGTQQ